MALPNRRAWKALPASEGLELNLSSYRLHQLPDSLGIETTPAELQSTSVPQTKGEPEKEYTKTTPITVQSQQLSSSDFEAPSKIRPVTKFKRLLPCIVAAIIALVVVLGLAVPLALQIRKPSNQASRTNSNSSTRIIDRLPASEAVNGTSLAVIVLDQNGVPDISLFYQDSSLHIRRLRSLELSPFIDGFPIVASNARKATPLTSLTYPTSSGELNSHLYYVDTNNTLQELYSSDNCTTWQVGSLGDNNFTASISSTALTAFYSNHWLGQDGNSTGIRIYYGAPDDQVHELAQFPNSAHDPSRYFSQSVFHDSNGSAGIASAWSEDSGLANLYLFGQNQQFQIWSNEFNVTDHTTAANASYGNWVNEAPQNLYSIKADTALSSTINTPSTNPPSTLCFQEVVEVSATTQITCSPLDSDGRLLSPSNAHPVTSGPVPLQQQGGALVAWWQAEPGADPWELNIFYQTANGDIVQDADANGPWINVTMPTI